MVYTSFICNKTLQRALKRLMDDGKKIIITIVHKFQFVLDAIDGDYKNKNFANSVNVFIFAIC